MEVVNNNDVVRDFINEELTNGKKLNKKELKRRTDAFYNEIKNNKKQFNFIINIMYLTSYIVTYNAYVMYPEDNGLKDDIEFLKSFNFTEELVSLMDEDIFYNLCHDTILFSNSDNYVKRKMILKLKDDSADIMYKFPFVINDFLLYLKEGNENDIINYYNKRLNKTGDKNVSLEDGICYGVEYLLRLSEDDPDNYRKVMYSIASQYYTYNKYLLLNNYDCDEYASDMIDLIESSFKDLIGFSLNNPCFLEPIVRDFILYNILSFDKKKEINDFYDKRNSDIENVQFYKNNYNSVVRKALYKIFGDIDFLDDDVILKYKDELDYLKNSDEFDYVVKVLYTDLMSINYINFDTYPNDEYYENEFNYVKSFNNINDFKKYLLEDDILLLDAIDKTIYFGQLPLLSKKYMIRNIMDNNIYNSYVTKEYVYDVLEFNRPFAIYDAYLIYEQNLIDEKDKKIAIAKSVGDLRFDLNDLDVLDNENYNNVIYDICDVYYRYNKYKMDCNGETSTEVTSIINDMENDLDGLLFIVKNDSNVQDIVLSSFYEYVSASEIDKRRVQNHYKELVDNGKVKIFNKKNKNS